MSSPDRYNQEIIDAHIHYWDPYTTPRSVSPAVKLVGRWPKMTDRLIRWGMPAQTINYFGKTELFTEPHLPDRYFADTGKYQIKGVVHVQADWQTKEPLGLAAETAWLDSLSRPPLAIIGEARVNDRNNFPRLLDAHAAASPRFRGVRDMLAHHTSGTIHNFCDALAMMRSDHFRSGFALLGERDLSFDAFIYSHQLPDLCRVVEAIPQTRVVLNHMGTPIGLFGQFGDLGKTAAERQKIQEAWYAGLTRLARSPQVMIKLSGLFMHVLGWPHHGWDDAPSVSEIVDKIGPHIRFALDTFGVERCMFASNFPPDKSLIRFETLYDAFFEIVADLDVSVQKKLFHDNAALLSFIRFNGNYSAPLAR